MWKEGNRGSTRLPWLTLLAGAAALFIHFGPGELSAALQLDRSGCGIEIVWQVLTSHLTHWSFDHLLWDLVVFGFVGALIEARSRRAWLGLFFSSAIAISLSVWFWQPDLRFYRGLSGVDMAFVGYWLCARFQDRGTGARWMWGIGLILTIAKPLFEIVMGRALFVSDLGPGVSNVPLAHLVGVGVGVVFALGTVGVYAMPGGRILTGTTRRGASGGPTEW